MSTEVKAKEVVKQNIQQSGVEMNDVTERNVVNPSNSGTDPQPIAQAIQSGPKVGRRYDPVTKTLVADYGNTTRNPEDGRTWEQMQHDKKGSKKGAPVVATNPVPNLSEHVADKKDAAISNVTKTIAENKKVDEKLNKA